MKKNILVKKTAKRLRGKVEQKSANKFKSIIVPVDFSDTSLKALDYALSLAAEFGSQLHLVHVLEFPVVFYEKSQSPYSTWDSQIEKSATSRLSKLIDEKVGEMICADSEVHYGRAYKVICDAARVHKADLIVIGTHGFTGLKHLLLGSTTEQVVRRAPCSVLVVRKHAGRNTKPILRPEKILIPTDFSKPAAMAFRSALTLAKQYQAQVHLLYVVPVHYPVGDYDMVDYAMLAAEQKEVAEKKLAELSKKLVAENMSVTTEIRHGRAAVEINNAVAESDCDLIVISTHGHTGWEHALMGSTAEEVVRHASCPVLISREK